MTHAINTALGSAPIPWAIDRQIGTINAVVAVLDMKFVIIQHRINTTKVRIYGDGWLPSAPITLSAINFPAPVFSSAAAKDSVPPNKKIVLRSIAFNASFSEITPVRIRSNAPIPPEMQSLIPIYANAPRHPAIHNLIPVCSSKIIPNNVRTKITKDKICFHFGILLKSCC